MNYIASEELGNLARCGLLLHMDFAYVLRQFNIQILLNVLCTLDNVHDPWASVDYGDGLANMNFKKSRHQVARLVGRSVFIESVDLQVIVVFVRAALKPNLRKFNVLR